MPSKVPSKVSQGGKVRGRAGSGPIPGRDSSAHSGPWNPRRLSLPAPFLHAPARSQGAGAAERGGGVEEAWEALEGGDAYGDLREALGG